MIENNHFDNRKTKVCSRDTVLGNCDKPYSGLIQNQKDRIKEYQADIGHYQPNIPTQTGF